METLDEINQRWKRKHVSTPAMSAEMKRLPFDSERNQHRRACSKCSPFWKEKDGDKQLYFCRSCSTCNKTTKRRKGKRFVFEAPRSIFDCPEAKWLWEGNKPHLPYGLQPFRVLDMNLSDRCNLACSFCYTNQGHGKGPDLERSKETIRWFLKQYNEGANQNQSKRGPSINFYGGEPLFEWEDLTRIIHWIRSGADGLAKSSVRLGVITNMTLLTEDKLDYCIQHNIGIHPSIDGGPLAQDMHRKYKNGKGSSDIVYEHARKLLLKRPGVSCRMTVTPETTQYMADSVIFLCDNVGFDTVNTILAGGVKWTRKDVELVKQQASKIAAYWLMELREGRHRSFYSIRNMLKGILNPYRKHQLCQAGNIRCAVDTEGTIWPCHRFTSPGSKAEFSMGNIRDGRENYELSAAVRGCDTSVCLEGHCSECIARASCHAHCPNELMNTNRIWLKDKSLSLLPRSLTCAVWPHYYKEAASAVRVLIEEENKLFYSKHLASLSRIRISRIYEHCCEVTGATPLPKVLVKSKRTPTKVRIESSPEAPPAQSVGATVAGWDPEGVTKDHDFLLSVVMSSRQEGNEVRDTVASVFESATGPIEVIVVDDSSTDHSCDPLVEEAQRRNDLTVIRTTYPVGAGRGRCIGAAASTGRVIAFVDAHMRFPKGGFHTAGAIAIDHQAIVNPGCQAMFGGIQGFGAQLEWHRTTRMGMKYVRQCNGIERRTGLIGAFYVLPREIYEQLGHWSSQLGIWGYEEPAIAAWAWFHDVPIYSIPMQAKHLFRSEKNTTLNEGRRIRVPWGGPPLNDVWLNTLEASEALFEEETCINVWREIQMTLAGGTQRPIVRATVEKTNMVGSGHWKTGKRHTDYEFFRDVMELPTEATESGAIKRIVPISVITMACNEGEEVKETLVSLIQNGKDPFEIIAVDDTSKDGSFDKLKERVKGKIASYWREGLDKRITILTHEKRQGTAQSRRHAISVAKGDVFVLFDAHMRCITRHAVDRLATAAQDTGGLIVAAVTGIGKAKDKNEKRIYGGRMTVKPKWGLYNSHINQKGDTRFAPRNSVIGACYAIRRDVLEEMGGWPNLPGLWAYNEQALGVKAFFLGIPMYCDTETLVEHLFKKKFNYPMPLESILLNAHRTHYIHFEDATYYSFWLPILKLHGWSNEIEPYLASKEVQREREEFLARRKYTDKDFFEQVLKMEYPPTWHGTNGKEELTVTLDPEANGDCDNC